MAEVRTTCPYCGVGCGVIVETAGERIVAVRGDPDHPANYGKLCSKGVTLAATLGESGRALYPELRRMRGSPRQRVSWDVALDHAAGRFAAAIAARGPDSVAFYISGQLLTEDYAVFAKLAKGLIGTHNVDTNSRLCMSSAVAGYRKTLGADAPPTCYDDLDHARCVFIAGSNAAWTHPVLFRRLEAAKARDPSLSIVVVDPRRTVTAEAADLHLALKPGSDVALFNAMLHVIVWESLVDEAFVRAHTRDFDAAKAAVREFTPALASELTGVPADTIVRAARMFAASGATLSLYCQGLNQSVAGTAKNVALINLHLATGQVGKPGAGPFSLTGQPNAMGGREVGGMATLLPGHREIANPVHRAEVAAIWGVRDVPAKPGLTAVEMFEAAADGALDALWIACTNPAQSLPALATVRRALERTPFVVVQDAYVTGETVRYADLLLPAASWAEREGTVTNSERRISRVRAAVAPPGEALPDWQIAAAFARRLEARLPRRATEDVPLFAYEGVEDVHVEHRAMTAGRDLDISGLSYRKLDRDGPQQWPLPEGATHGRARLYGDGRFATEDGRARFVATPHVGVADRVDVRHPMRLSTGRLRDQWHGMSRTGRATSLAGHAPEPRLALHPGDIARLGLAEGEWALVTSRRGTIAVPVAASDAQPKGQAFLPMHWGANALAGPGGAAGVNELTPAALDPDSRQPEYKHAAVRIERAPFVYRAAWWRRAGADPVGTLARLRHEVRDIVGDMAHTLVALHDGVHPGIVLRVGADRRPEGVALDRLDTLFTLDEGGLRYEDARQGIARRARQDEGCVVAFHLAGDFASEAWLRELLLGGLDTAGLGIALVRGGAQAPRALPPRGSIVCQCGNVGSAAIEAALPDALAAPDPLAWFAAELNCGANCGSCRPEVMKRVRAAQASEVVQ